MPAKAVHAKKVRTTKVTTIRAKPEMEVEAPTVDLVRVKVLPNRDGYYGYRELMQERFQDASKNRWFVGRDPTIRNADEVFLMDAFDMKEPVEEQQRNPKNFDEFVEGSAVRLYTHGFDLGDRKVQVEVPADAVIIETPNAGRRVLTEWVELAEQDEEITPQTGHKRAHGVRNGEVL